jgi:hypothetical protein
MKKLVLGSLLLAALVSQTTGCIITSDDGDDDIGDEFARMDVEWSFVDVDASGRPIRDNGCPAGYGSVTLHNQQFDPVTDQDIGPEILDVFDCVDEANFTDELDPGVYESFLSVTNGIGGPLYASSISAIVDVTATDKTFTSQIVDNGGYFRVDWDLRRQGSNALLACRDVANIDGVEITATLSGTSTAVVDTFDCEDGFGYSAAVREGNYVVKVDALNTSDQAIGPGALLNNKTVGIRNDIEDLGIVQLQIP